MACARLIDTTEEKQKYHFVTFPHTDQSFCIIFFSSSNYYLIIIFTNYYINEKRHL